MDSPSPDPSQPLSPRGIRLRLTIGAGVVLVVVAAAVAVLVSVLSPRPSTREVTAPATISTVSPSGAATPAATIFVDVQGLVRAPGLYQLRPGARVVDAIAAAGGFAAHADGAQLNLARLVSDGEQLVVPKVGEAPRAPGPSGATGQGSGQKVDINTADESALETLDGVGPALAQRILDYRVANGRFSSIDDLKNVSGIGDKKFAAIKDAVTL